MHFNPFSSFSRHIKRLFSVSGKFQPKPVDPVLFDRLPAPAQRYFKHVLTENQNYISSARLIHDGEFRVNPNQKWSKIKGEEYFTIEPPGFVWRGKVPFMSATDLFINKQGNLQIHLFQTIRIINKKDEKINQGELLRWLAEAPWFPTALLPSKNLSWEKINDSECKIIFSSEGIDVDARVHINNKGEITKLQAKRFKDDTLNNWTGIYNNYQKVNGMLIPMSCEVSWNLEEGDFCYARFNIKKIEYNIPKQF
ncbi:DUF6920 family protein [Saccharicrinis sp. FJH54]|uniref:DUF6920 family protein n=1 Tax=Saccharicrinis sp. FJH54 TaxID=3344665 RepID=UPI0035D52AFC